MSLFRSAAAGLFLLPAALLFNSCVSQTESGPPPSANWQRRISYYEKKISDDPRHFPSHTMLASAYLEKAGETFDLKALKLSRDHAQSSIKIQPNFEAFKVMARIEGFEHRFENSIEWAQKAAEAAPESVADAETAAILVDAYLGLGKSDEALRVINSLRDDGFHKQSAMGNYLKAEGRPADAERAFVKASEAALKENAGAAQAWAEVMAAGVWIDSGNARKALPHLEKAAKIYPRSKALLIHRAEYYELEGEPEKATDIYLSLLGATDDPEIHRRLCRIYRIMGLQKDAAEHFELAEKGFRRVIDAGYVFALGPMAQLLCDAGVELDEARRLSAENLKYKMDAEALATEKCVAAES